MTEDEERPNAMVDEESEQEPAPEDPAAPEARAPHRDDSAPF